MIASLVCLGMGLWAGFCIGLTWEGRRPGRRCEYCAYDDARHYTVRSYEPSEN